MTADDIFEFWAVPDKWPIDSSSHVFLARAINEIGQTLFPDDWRPFFDIIQDMTDPLPERLWRAQPRDHDRAFDLLRRHRPDLGLEPKRRKLTGIEWELARAIISDLNKRERPAVERFNKVKLDIISGAQAKKLVTAVRPTRGGQIAEAPSWWWNSEHISNRFKRCELNPNDPFGSGFAGNGFCLIFVTRESLKAYLNECSQPKSEIAEPVPAVLPDHGNYYDLVSLPGKKQQAVLSAIKTVWPDGKIPRLLSIADIENQINPVVKRMGDPGGASADNIRRALGLKK
jgi:hypothetical protein